MKGNILIFGNPDSHLMIQRSRIPAEAGYRVYWFSWRKPKTNRLQHADWLCGLIVPPSLRRGGNCVAALWLYLAFLRLQPCIAHVHYALTAWPYAGWIARLHPLIVSVMGGDIMADQGFHGEFVEPTRYLLTRADIITTKSKFMDQVLVSIGLNQQRMRRVTWGVDAEQFRPGLDVSALRQRWDLGADDVVLFCARVCEPRTNKRLVVEAFARCLPRLRYPARLLISEYLGDPAYCEQLHQLVVNLGIGKHVRFVGEIPQEEMPAFLNLAEAVISVPKSDGMPQTLYQAMACGAYPIISDIPHTRELIDLGCELSVTPSDDADALGTAMLWVVEHRGQAREMGLRNRERILPVANKTEQNKSMVAIYDDLLSKAWGQGMEAWIDRR